MVTETERDAAWIDGIRRGDEEAFAALVRAYYTGLFDFACAVTHRSEAAEDVVQDVLLAVWEGRHDWRPAGTARAYLYRAVRNRALNEVRARKVRRAAPLDPDASVSPEPPADAGVDYEALLGEYHAAVAELPARRREVFRLSRLYGLTYEEIAGVLGVSLNTVRTQMTAALKHLRARLARHFE